MRRNPNRGARITRNYTAISRHVVIAISSVSVTRLIRRLNLSRAAVVSATGETSTQLALRDPDIRLMLRVRDDDAGAFAELVELYQHRLVAVMHHLVGNADEAEDLAQEVFLRVYRGRKKYHPRSKFSTWLFTIANNLALNALRVRQRKPVVPLDVHDSGPLGPRPAEQLVPDRGSRPMQRMQQQELAAVIRQALEASTNGSAWPWCSTSSRT